MEQGRITYRNVVLALNMEGICLVQPFVEVKSNKILDERASLPLPASCLPCTRFISFVDHFRPAYLAPNQAMELECNLFHFPYRCSLARCQYRSRDDAGADSSVLSFSFLLIQSCIQAEEILETINYYIAQILKTRALAKAATAQAPGPHPT